MNKYERSRSTIPLRLDPFEEGIRPRDWQPRRTGFKGPLKFLRLCVLGVLLPILCVAIPVYLRFRCFSEQLYPLAISDQRLIDSKISTVWCQKQIIKGNATFNAYLMQNLPKIKSDVTPVSMTRHLVLEDDMKEYWGFYLLRGSSVTVSTCVRWPGASLTMIRGHKHLHECAFIGDDSSEELEELVELAQEQGILQKFNESIADISGVSNEPALMKRVRQGISFHHEHNGSSSNNHHRPQFPSQHTSHELDAKDMRAILTQLFLKTLDTKRRQKESSNASTTHHHYEGVFKEAANIDKPPAFDEQEFIRQELLSLKDESVISKDDATTSTTTTAKTNEDEGITKVDTLLKELKAEPSSEELYEDTLKKIQALGERGKKVLDRLVHEINREDPRSEEAVRRTVDAVATKEEQRRRKREIILSSPLATELTEDDQDGDAAIEEGVLHPDGIAEDRGSVNETSLNDMSKSEFWSSFSSSEERLLECKGLILNLPLTPHRFCEARHEPRHADASVANTVTYRVPSDGYYFFVFSSENEIQPNYLRTKFELLRTRYNVSNPLRECRNRTGPGAECSLPMSFWSSERTVLELPVAGSDDSRWNEEYVVVSTCEPRTAVYLVCTMAVPLLILAVAFY
ncbi:hypothetical protein TKK_0008304 [Trichogramma kaykai]|uniref:E3 ubiquitin-protein ligase APD1-4 middle domain-containing protein n=1 Tax=Trichogramma kaykai TaxID=54128 RepID=A0ABD2X6C5_9HYME